jgi:hypothetical protein
MAFNAIARCSLQSAMPRIQIVSGASRRYRPFNIQVTLGLPMIELPENNDYYASNSTLQDSRNPTVTSQ